MTSQQNREMAVNLVDRMDNLTDEKRSMLKSYIGEAAMGDEVALTHVILFPYHKEHYDIISSIINLIFSNRHCPEGGIQCGG